MRLRLRNSRSKNEKRILKMYLKRIRDSLEHVRHCAIKSHVITSAEVTSESGFRQLSLILWDRFMSGKLVCKRICYVIYTTEIRGLEINPANLFKYSMVFNILLKYWYERPIKYKILDVTNPFRSNCSFI